MTTNDATAPVPTPSTTACTVIGSYDISDDEVCELLAFCQSGTTVGGRTMLARGEADQASMDEEAFQKFWTNRDKVPDEFARRHYFAFPKAVADGDVRYASRLNGDWVHFRYSFVLVWFGFAVLVRFRRKRS